MLHPAGSGRATVGFCCERVQHSVQRMTNAPRRQRTTDAAAAAAPAAVCVDSTADGVKKDPATQTAAERSAE